MPSDVVFITDDDVMKLQRTQRRSFQNEIGSSKMLKHYTLFKKFFVFNKRL